MAGVPPSQDVMDFLAEVHQFLAESLPPLPLPATVEVERQRLLLLLQRLRPQEDHCTDADGGLTVAGSEVPDGGLTEKKARTEAVSSSAALCNGSGGKKDVRRSGSLSSRSSSSASYTSTSYTSTGYTSTSYTSNGYSSYEGAAAARVARDEQEDIYEECDGAQLRIGSARDGVDSGNCTAATGSTAAPSATTGGTAAPSAATISSNTVSTSTPFFSHLRNSLTYGRKDKRDSLVRDKAGEAKDTPPAESKSKKSEKKAKKEKKSNGKENSVSENTEEKDNRQDDGIVSLPEHTVTPEDTLQDAVGEDDDAAEEDKEEAEGSYMEDLQAMSFSSAIASCARHGVLHKRSRALLRSWRPFRCVVVAGVLLLYNRESDRRQRKGLDLSTYDVRVATGEDTAQGRRDLPYLELVAPARKTHTFMARSTNDRDAWIHALGQYTRTRPVLPPPSTDTPSSSATNGVTDTRGTSLEGDSGDTCDGSSTASSTLKAARQTVRPGLSAVTGLTGAVPDEEDTLSTTGSQEETFSSDEMYEEVNMDDIRASSGPSLSEMLGPHLFMGDALSTYYTVPNDDPEGAVPTSTPKKTFEENLDCSLPCLAPKGAKPAPPRPPPPSSSLDQNKPPTKNNSVLHHKIIGSGSALLDVLKSPGLFTKLSSSPAKRSPPSACRQLGFTSSSRPLPATPFHRPSNEGEIYCEIEEEEGYYEESESDGVSFLAGSLGNSHDKSYSSGKKPYSVTGSPPPLPSRGPPPAPVLTQQSRAQLLQEQDRDLTEDYDIPGEVTTADTRVLSTNGACDSDSLAPIPQDLSAVLPSYFSCVSPKQAEPPPLVPVKGSFASNKMEEDDNVYKVPSSAPLSESIYQVPSSHPVPVNNTSVTCSQQPEVEAVVPDARPVPDLYKSSFANVIEVADRRSSDSDVSDTSSSAALNTSEPHKQSKEDESKATINAKKALSIHDAVSTSVASERILGNRSRKAAVKANNVSVKECIALFNRHEGSGHSLLPGKCADDVVVMVGAQEIRLDQTKKKAFLESTLNFDALSQGRPDMVGSSIALKKTK